jgi:hypothetical protein
MEAPQWREEAGGTFVAETVEFTIKVRRTANRQHVRFIVLKQIEVLVGSGMTADIAAAMNAGDRAVTPRAICDRAPVVNYFGSCDPHEPIAMRA